MALFDRQAYNYIMNLSDKTKDKLKTINDLLDYFSIAIILLLIIYLYSALINPIVSKEVQTTLKYILIGYFVFELLIKYLLAKSFKYFITNYWLDILLVIPFFKSLKLFGLLGKGLKSVKILKSIKIIKIIKTIPYTQKAIKIVKKIKKSIKVIQKDK